EGIGDADGGGGFELHLDVVLIVLLQKGTVNDIENVLPVFVPVFLRQLGGHISQLLGQVVAAHIVVAFQHSRQRPNVPFLQLPQPGGAGMFPRAGVGNIEHIAQAGPVPGIVHQGDALGTAPHIPAHAVIPQVVLGAGGSVRALSVDHQLLMEWILLEPGSSGEKARPLLPTAGELDRDLLRHLRVHFCFGWHGYLSSLPFRNRKGAARWPPRLVKTGCYSSKSGYSSSASKSASVIARSLARVLSVRASSSVSSGSRWPRISDNASMAPRRLPGL